MIEKEYQQYDDEIEMKELISILFREKRFIIKWTVVVTIIVLLASVGMHFFKPPINLYVAQEEVTLVKKEAYPARLEMLTSLSESRVVAEIVKKELGLSQKISDIMVNMHTTVSTEDGSVLISFMSEDRDQAIRTVEEWVNQVIRISKGSMGDKSLDITQKANLSNELVEARPPINIKLNTAIGFILGLMGTVFICFFLEAMNDRIRTVDDVERKLGAQILGSIPKHKTLELE